MYGKKKCTVKKRQLCLPEFYPTIYGSNILGFMVLTYIYMYIP